MAKSQYNIIKKNIKILKSQEKEFEKRGKALVNQIMKGIYMRDDLDDFYKNWWCDMAEFMICQRPLKQLQYNIKKFEHELNNLQIKQRILPEGITTITQENVNRAKEYPLINLIKTNRAGFAKCPFHSEKTASFRVYPKENRWHCFGACNKGGDAIDFVGKLYNLTFLESVKFLINK